MPSPDLPESTVPGKCVLDDNPPENAVNESVNNVPDRPHPC